MIRRKFKEINLEEEAFFGVRRVPIYYLPEDISLKPCNGPVRIPNHTALLIEGTDSVLSVVSEQYNVITNKQACEFADLILPHIFQGVSIKQFKAFNIVTPSTMTTCRMDFILPENYYHPFSGNLEDKWTPFIRISNSFNRTLKLRYDIGFCRWMCLNGMILGERSITIGLNHNDRYYESEIRRQLLDQVNQLVEAKTIWDDLSKILVVMRNFMVPQDCVLPMYCKAFGVSLEKDDLTDIIKSNWKNRRKAIDETKGEYFKEMGYNAYALMNILSDYASAGVPKLYRDGYQRKLGSWVDEFGNSITDPHFSLDKYLEGKPMEMAELIESF